jgi:HPt (histidine-containing phosphotransfer) domain-containing protein
MATSILDIETLLERTLNDRDLTDLLISKFYEQMTTILNDMDTALNNKDVKELLNLAHKLKGSSATICSSLIRDKSLELEVFLKEREFDENSITGFIYDLKQYHEQFYKMTLN